MIVYYVMSTIQVSRKKIKMSFIHETHKIIFEEFLIQGLTLKIFI